MSTNKNAVLRYNTLDKCFSNFGRKYSFDDLLEKVNEALLDYAPTSEGIKTRQLRDDISFMRSEAGYAAPIETFKDGGKDFYYRYENKDFSINNSPLNETEAEQLKAAISVLQRFEGAPQFEWMSEIGPMLTSQLGLNNAPEKVIAYDTNIDYSGYHHITPLFNAIINQRVLKVSYAPFDKPVFDITFHPYYLKQYNNRWFCLGLNQELAIPTWNLALDRIQGISEIDAKYSKSKIDWEDHFYDIIGVTTSANCQTEEVELLFTKEQASYIQTKPLHASQRANVLDTGELRVTIKVVPNIELEMKLLSFGEKVTVIKPVHLKKRILTRVLQATERYT